MSHRPTSLRRRISLGAAAGAIAVAVSALGCGGGSGRGAAATRPAPATASVAAPAPLPATAPSATASTPSRPVTPLRARPAPVVLPAAHDAGLHGMVPAVRVGATAAVSIARVAAPGQSGSSVTLLRLEPTAVHLVLHAGSTDPGGSGWAHGDSISSGESHRVVAAFNGGFHLATDAGGFLERGRVGYRLRSGAASIVTYADGATDIGAWRSQVPAPHRAIASVRQNLTLLVDGGAPAANIGCRLCWGATLGGGTDVARAALAVTADGALLWAGGEALSPAALAGALIDHGAQRAVELDINPQWVAGYLYTHGRGGRGSASPLAVVPGQTGTPGAFLTSYSRDFFSVVAAG